MRKKIDHESAWERESREFRSRARDRDKMTAEQREKRDAMMALRRDGLDRRTLPHPNRHHPSTLEEKIARGLRDEREVNLTYDQVKEIAKRLGIREAPITPYQLRKRSIITYGPDEPVNANEMMRRMSRAGKIGKAVKRKREVIARKSGR